MELDDLIKKYCPDGCEWKRLDEIAAIQRGERITKKQLVKDGQYPVISGGREPMGRYDKTNREANTITIASYGTAGYINYITEPFWANDVCLSVFPNEDIVLNKYLYFALANKQQYFYENTIGSYPEHIRTEFIKETMIPVPPLPVQQWLADFLDEFSDATEKLQALLQEEIGLRKKQYTYYRDKLINDDLKNCKWIPLGELGKFYSGLTVLKNWGDDYLRVI